MTKVWKKKLFENLNIFEETPESFISFYCMLGRFQLRVGSNQEITLFLVLVLLWFEIGWVILIIKLLVLVLRLSVENLSKDISMLWFCIVQMFCYNHLWFLSFLPSSFQIEIKLVCHLTTRQRWLYQAVKNKISIDDLVYTSTSSSSTNATTSSLMNLVMQFRKVREDWTGFAGALTFCF